MRALTRSCWRRFPQSTSLARLARPALTIAASLLLAGTPAAQVKHYPLDAATGLWLHHVKAQPAELQGKQGLRLTEDVASPPGVQVEINGLATIEGLTFSSGTIEAEIAGAPAPRAFEGARGFVGIAFRVQDENTYDAFYLRPTNGRADDQERRNHSVQYISHPQWPWQRLRQEIPSKYEAYVDLVPGEWTKVKIEVRGERARLYVPESAQPTLIVNDLKSGAQKAGAVALWIGPGTVAHFRNLRVEALSQ
jgi:hypothetical protein